jgi:hypothetical protein
MMVLAGIVLFHGGIAGEHWQLPCPLGVVSLDENQRHVFCGSIVLEEQNLEDRFGWGSLALFQLLKVEPPGAMYAVTGDSKMLHLLGLPKSCHPNADSLGNKGWMIR